MAKPAPIDQYLESDTYQKIIVFGQVDDGFAWLDRTIPANVVGLKDVFEKKQ